VRRRRDVEWDASRDRQPVALKADDLLRVVRDETHLFDAEIDQDLRTETVVAFVDRKSQSQIRLDRIGTAVLQLVGAQLVGQAYAPAFLM
jgi:hypothetical protein